MFNLQEIDVKTLYHKIFGEKMSVENAPTVTSLRVSIRVPQRRFTNVPAIAMATQQPLFGYIVAGREASSQSANSALIR